jgi:hypothetical protein
MNPISNNATRALLFAAFALAAACGRSGEAAEPRPGPHLVLTNATFDSVIDLAIAPSGENAYRSIPLGTALRGGLTSTTVDVPEGGCLRDIRLTFRGGRVHRLENVDLCRHHALRLDPAPAPLRIPGSATQTAAH